MWFFIFALSLRILFCSSQMIRHSALGEYHVEWREFGPCPLERRGTGEVFSDVHLTRKNKKPELYGNLTLAVPFDDTTPMKVNFAILGMNSAWIPNFYSMTFLRGCSDGYLAMFNEGWVNYMLSFGISPACPVPKGFHRTRGYDPDNFLKNSMLPKQFVYGRYKMEMEYYTKRNTLMGCSYLTIDVVPIWQKKKSNRTNSTS
ncbi:uncharacterized protein LOC135842504 [Planococcus citri]|uniref:uncharacterized protein LOC135842504 n=1 Tax=Planococcus citri TaxID=170843 RepID=UPI0031F80041